MVLGSACAGDNLNLRGGDNIITPGAADVLTGRLQKVKTVGGNFGP